MTPVNDGSFNNKSLKNAIKYRMEAAKRMKEDGRYGSVEA
jgi:hypothetical protein